MKITNWVPLCAFVSILTLAITAYEDAEQVVQEHSTIKNLKESIHKQNINITSLQSLLKNVDMEEFIDDFNIKSMLQELVSLRKQGVKFSLPTLSDGCTKELEKFSFLMNITDITPTVIYKILTSPAGKMLDAWGKPSSRVLLGNVKWLGAYDECQEMDGMRYCLTSMKFLTLFPGSYGVCMPKQCSATDVYEVLQLVQTVMKGIIYFPPPDATHGAACIEEDDYDSAAVATIVFISILACLCVLGTLLELLQDACSHNEPAESDNLLDGQQNECVEGLRGSSIVQPSEQSEQLNPIPIQLKQPVTRGNTIIQLFICFSLVKNIRAIVSTSLPKGAIGSINGIRTISMWWVILGHFYFFGAISQNFDNLNDVGGIIHRFTFMAVSNAYVAVDTFFLLSGLLVGYLTLKRMDMFEGKNKSYIGLFWAKYYLHRYIRLTPSLGFLMLFYNNVFPLLITGPWKSSGYQGHGLVNFRKACNKYWWTNLLYINNFWPKNMGDQCVGWVWYLANDWQFYFISPLILYCVFYIDRYLSTRRIRYLGPFAFMLCLCVISFIVTGALVGVHDWPSLITASYIPNNPRVASLGDHQNRIYEKPDTRIPPYLVGLFLGYVFSRKIRIRYGITKIISLVGWIAAITVALLVVYGPWHVFKENGTFFTKTENIFYDALHRFAFSVAVAWVIYACHNHVGGLVDKFLSWRIWIPLSRLTYGAYLMHPLVLIYFITVQDNVMHYQDNIAVFNIISVVVVSYACSFIMALLVEYPVLNLEKKILK